MKNQKGFTLVEVLAVVIVLGIITAIAVPTMQGVIEKNKKDAYVSTAQQLIESARLAELTNDSIMSDNEVSLKDLLDNGYILKVSNDPWGNEYDVNNTKVVLSNSTYSVYLTSTDGSDETHHIGTSDSPVAESSLSADEVK